jgi:hypothetical protein
MDDKLKKVLDNYLDNGVRVETFKRAFRRVFGFTPTVTGVGGAARAHNLDAHGETWNTDAAGNLLWFDANNDSYVAINDIDGFLEARVYVR